MTREHFASLRYRGDYNAKSGWAKWDSPSMPYSGIDEKTRKRPASSDRSSGSIWQRFDAPTCHGSESLSLALSKFSHFHDLSNARIYNCFCKIINRCMQNYNSKYFIHVGNAFKLRPVTRNSNISLLFIIRIIMLLNNRAFCCMRLPYPSLPT